MWCFPFQLSLATLFVTTWLLAAVEGQLIDDLSDCKQNISLTYEDICAKYDKYPDQICRPIYETAQCLVEKACMYCSAKVAKLYAIRKDNWIWSKFKERCQWYLEEAGNLFEYCQSIKPTTVTLPSSMSNIASLLRDINDVTEITEITSVTTSQPKQSKSAVLTILVIVLVLLLLAGLAFWCICYRRRRRRKTFKLTTGRRSAKSMKSTTKSSPN